MRVQIARIEPARTHVVVSVGPQHTISLPPDLQGIPIPPGPTASRLAQDSHQRPARFQVPLASAQSVPAGGSRLGTLSQPPFSDWTRLTSVNLGVQEQQQALYQDRAAGGPTALRRLSHVSHGHVMRD